MNKEVMIIVILLLLISTSIYAEVSSSPIDWLSRGQGDIRYCMINGECTILTLIVENITATNYINLTVIDINVTRDMDISGNLNVDGNITGTIDSSYILNENWVNETGDTMSGDLIINADLYAEEGNFSGDVKITDDLYARDGYFSRDMSIGDDLEVGFDLDVLDDAYIRDDFHVYGYARFYDNFYVDAPARFNDSILLRRGGNSILEVETTSADGSAQIRVLADGTNDLYIYTYSSAAIGNYYGFPRAGSSYVDAQGDRLIIGTFDTSPLYLATHQDPRLIITSDGDVIPFDDDDITLANRTNRFKDIYVVGKETQGIHFVKDDETYGNLSMDGDFNLLWNGEIINASAIGVNLGNGSLLTDLTHSLDDAYDDGSVIQVDDGDLIWQITTGKNFYVNTSIGYWRIAPSLGSIDLEVIANIAGKTASIYVGDSDGEITLYSGVSPVLYGYPTLTLEDDNYLLTLENLDTAYNLATNGTFLTNGSSANFGNVLIDGDLNVTGSASFGNGAGTANFNNEGQLTLSGTARPKRELIFKATSAIKGASAPSDTLRDIGASGNVKDPVISFSKVTQQDIYGTFHPSDDMDESVEVRFHLMWIPGESWTSGAYNWSLEYLIKAEDASYSVDGANTTLGTPIIISELITPTNAQSYIETEFTDTISINKQQILIAHFYRDISDDADDVGEVRFFEVEYFVNSLGEYI